MASPTSAPLVWMEVARLLRAEVVRLRAGWANTYGSSARSMRLRAARQLLAAIAGAAGLVWSLGWLTAPALTGDIPVGDARIRALTGSAALLFLFVVDGAGVRHWTRTDWEGRFADRWLPAAGVHPLAVSVRHTLRRTLRALPFAWVPLLPVQAALLECSIGRRLLLLLAAPACHLAGDAIGVLSRRARRWIGAAFAACAVAYWLSLLALLVGYDGATGAVLAPARTLLLSRWSVVSTLVFFALAAVTDVVANRWSAERTRAQAAAGPTSKPAHRPAPGEIRTTGQGRAHVQATLRRLSSWVCQQWLATVIVGVYAGMPAVAIIVKYSRLPDAMTVSQAIGVLAFGLALPALVCSEIVWGTLARDMWALIRNTARSLHVPLLAPAAVCAGILFACAVIYASAISVATPGGVRSGGALAAAGLLLATHCVAWQAFAATLALRLGATRTAAARAVRYAATVVGLLIPVLIANVGGPWVCALWVATVALVSSLAAVDQFSRCEFGHALRSE